MADDQLPPGFGEALGALEASIDVADPIDLARSLVTAFEHAALRPWDVYPLLVQYGASLATIGLDFAAQLTGAEVDTPEDAESTSDGEPIDPRFADAIWRENAFFRALLRWYQLTARLLVDLVAASDLEPPEKPKAEFTARLLADTIAPTNVLLTNPTALRRAFDTGGVSILRGMRNFLDDVVENHGWPRQVDGQSFRVGENLAATPGKVVFRNELMELIQYTPQTDEVYETPLLFCPPWINRYYIADLAPGRSLIEWSVQHGHTTFAISYRNPDESMRDIGFDDYLRLGPLTAIDVVRSITESQKANLVGICLGGSLNTALVAYLDACGDDFVSSLTYLNAANDYGDSGVLCSVFTNERSLDVLRRHVERQGYIDAKGMAHSFDLLRANDLVFRYLVSGWLLGERPPAFDLLAWNNDSPNVPGKAHLFFLEKMYLEHALVRDQLELLGERLMVSEITTDTYIVAAVEDHIVPWRSSYKTTQLLKGPVRFVLTSAGHIAGIVNPPNSKKRLWTNEELPSDPDQWRSGAVERADTWWNDWVEWLGTRSGARRPPPPIGNDVHPPTGDAPGTYVVS